MSGIRFYDITTDQERDASQADFDAADRFCQAFGHVQGEYRKSGAQSIEVTKFIADVRMRFYALMGHI